METYDLEEDLEELGALIGDTECTEVDGEMRLGLPDWMVETQASLVEKFQWMLLALLRPG